MCIWPGGGLEGRGNAGTRCCHEKVRCERDHNHFPSHLHANNEIPDIHSRTPLQRTYCIFEFPVFELATDVHLPQAYKAIFISADNPSSIWTYTHTPCATVCVGEFQ